MWISKLINKKSRNRKLLTELQTLVKEYDDPAKPNFAINFFAYEFPHFRPDSWYFLTIVFSFGLFGFIGQLFNYMLYELSILADIAIAVVIPVFVIGVSLTILSHTISESGKFVIFKATIDRADQWGAIQKQAFVDYRT